MYFTILLKKETLKLEDIKYYFDKKWGLFKKVGFDEYYYSRKELDWIECQIVFILPAWDYQCVITADAAEKIIEENMLRKSQLAHNSQNPQNREGADKINSDQLGMQLLQKAFEEPALLNRLIDLAEKDLSKKQKK